MENKKWEPHADYLEFGSAVGSTTPKAKVSVYQEGGWVPVSSFGNLSVDRNKYVKISNGVRAFYVRAPNLYVRNPADLQPSKLPPASNLPLADGDFPLWVNRGISEVSDESVTARTSVWPERLNAIAWLLAFAGAVFGQAAAIPAMAWVFILPLLTTLYAEFGGKSEVDRPSSK